MQFIMTQIFDFIDNFWFLLILEPNIKKQSNLNLATHVVLVREACFGNILKPIFAVIFNLTASHFYYYYECIPIDTIALCLLL
jgi:hypothetical protein